MIIVKLMGGLGNQMFQYAGGRHLAHLHKTQLKLDLSWLGSKQPGTTQRTYALTPFSIQAEPASKDEIAKLSEPEYSPLRQLLNRHNPFYRPYPSHIREKCFRFDPTILTLPDNVYLEGYWQSELYFADIAGILREEFSIRVPLAGENLRIADAMKGCCAVSLHVRRGDYVSDPETAAFHGICGLDYYAGAVEMLALQVPSPHFFVFSDDITWVMKHLRIDHAVTFVDHNPPDKGYEDMRLMSLCHHHIIANSSFSWWGAWLTPRPDKIVIAPSRWFNDPAIDTSDQIPASWLRIAL